MQKVIILFLISFSLFSCSTPETQNDFDLNDIQNAVKIKVVDKVMETRDSLIFLKTKYLLISKFRAHIFSFYADYICIDSLGHKLYSGNVKFNQAILPGQSVEYWGEVCKDETMISGLDTVIMNYPLNKLSYTFKVTEVDTVNRK